MQTPAIIKPRAVKDAAVGDAVIDFQPEEEKRDHPQTTAQTADKNINSVIFNKKKDRGATTRGITQSDHPRAITRPPALDPPPLAHPPVLHYIPS